jgi:hypothetical protein
MNPPARSTGDGCVHVPIGYLIRNLTLHLLAGSWAAISEMNHRHPLQDHVRDRLGH